MTRHTFYSRLLLPLICALLIVPAIHAAPGAATVSYRRVFKGSTPEFIEIKITEPGKATFEIRQLEEDPNPEPFEVGAPVRQKILELAASLNNFDIPSLDIHKKIANLGEKTFRYERDGEVHQTTFNYTLSVPANQLMQIFEGLARQQTDLTLLVRNVKYDRLGVNDALMQFESDMDHRLLPEPERFLSVLDQIAADSHFVDIARTRARAIAQNIRNTNGH
ncbi:MAG: hypothetical protein LAO19_03020 [Acidobacteriia bacterium]|nr:hypothetical protein [Terriglobia bacterium]